MNNGIRVLVADDDPVSRLMVMELLGIWGYEVIAAGDGNEAWNCLTSDFPPAIAILDWEMPGMDGSDICRRLRSEQGKRSPVHLILLTARKASGDVVAGLQSGADDYLTKPFDRDELRARVSVAERIVVLQQALARRLHEVEDTLTAIQQTFLIGRIPQDISGVRLAARLIPFGEVTGDFHAFHVHCERRFDVIIGDVMGKGMKPALLGAASVHQFLRSFSDCRRSMAGRHVTVVEAVREFMEEMGPRFGEVDSYLTLCYARFDLEARVLKYTCFGHPWPMHLRADSGTVAWLEVPNGPIGLVEWEDPVEVVVPLHPGDLFLFWSDGVTDTLDVDNEAFGRERAREVVERNAHAGPEAMINALFEASQAFSRNRQFTDDATCIAVQIE